MTGLELFLAAIIIVIVIFVIPYLRNLLRMKVIREEKMAYLSKKLKKGGTVFLGDSLTEFYPTDEFFEGFCVINRGIAGDTAEEVLDRIDDIYELQPKKVFILIGTNDMGQGKSDKKILDTIKEILTDIKKNVAGVTIYIQSEYPICKSKHIASPIFCGLRTNARLNFINRKLEEFANTIENVKYIDVATSLMDEKGRMKKEYTLEGLHLSTEGYKVVTEVLLPYVKE